jgi:hypothetical protein
MNNGNMVRVIMTPFDYNYEWEQLNYYDSKIDIDTVPWGSSPDSYELVGRLALAYELDSLLMMCEDLGVYIILCQEYHFQFSSSHPNPSGYLNYPYIWSNNPYNTIPGVDSVTDFLTMDIARKYYQHKIRYTLSRWGYSTAILGHEFINEVDQVNCIGSYDQSDGKDWSYCPYYDGSDKGIQFINDLEDWHISMLEYIRDPRYLNFTNHLYSTSYGTLPKDPDNIPASIDFVNWHPYSSDELRHRSRYNTLNNFYQNNPSLWNKPFYIGETGLSGSTSGGCPANGFYFCNDISFHNDLWATAMICGMSTGMHWWWNKGIIDNQLHVLEPLRIFFDSLDLVNNNINTVGSSWDISLPFGNPDTVQYFYSRTSNHELIYGWIHNYDVQWKNFISASEDCLVNSDPGWSEDCIPQNSLQIDSVYAELLIENISGDHSFTVQKFNTRTGLFYPPENHSSINGKLTIPFGYLGTKPQDTESPADFGFIITKD